MPRAARNEEIINIYFFNSTNPNKEHLFSSHVRRKYGFSNALGQNFSTGPFCITFKKRTPPALELKKI